MWYEIYEHAECPHMHAHIQAYQPGMIIPGNKQMHIYPYNNEIGYQSVNQGKTTW